MGIQDRLRQIAGMAGRGVIPGRHVPPVNFHPPTVRDAIGRVLELGDEVLSVQPHHHLRVASVRHVTTPGAPPNLVELILVSRVQVAVPQGANLDGVYYLRHASEIRDGFLQNIGAAPEATGVPEAPEAPEAPAHPLADPDAPTTAAGPAIHLTDRGD